MATKYHLRKRVFLNRAKDMPAYVIAIVEDTSTFDDADDKCWKYGTIELRIADCVRSISLDFYMGDAASRSASLYKIRRLAEIVSKVRDAIEREAASIAARPKKKKPADKAKAASAG